MDFFNNNLGVSFGKWKQNEYNIHFVSSLPYIHKYENNLKVLLRYI